MRIHVILLASRSARCWTSGCPSGIQADVMGEVQRIKPHPGWEPCGQPLATPGHCSDLADVVFHDSARVHTVKDDGSDEARFVQVIQGQR